MTSRSMDSTRGVRPLFDAVLAHRAEMAPVTLDGEGEMIGSGDGLAEGPLSGTLRWTLFEEPGPIVCTMNPVIVLDTDDGAAIRIRGRGYARRKTDFSAIWRVAATLEFETDDTDYAWLDGAFGFWEGEFIATEGRASYRAYTSERGIAALAAKEGHELWTTENFDER